MLAATTTERAAVSIVESLTYQALEEAYQSACFGRDEPTELRASGQTRDDLVHFLVGMAGIEAFGLFNSCTIGTDRNLPDGVAVFLGGRHDAYLVFRRISQETQALIAVGRERCAGIMRDVANG